MAYCTHCGAEYQEDVKFCGECGAAMNGSAASTARRRENTPPTHEFLLWEGKPAGISDRLKGMIRLNTTTYTITSQRIKVKIGLIGKNIEEIELLRVQDFSIEQSIPERILGIGNLIVFSEDASSPQLKLRKIRNVQSVKDVLRTAVREEKSAHNISYREQL